MSDENAPPEGVVGVVKIWAEAEVTHGPNWKPEDHLEEDDHGSH